MKFLIFTFVIAFTQLSLAQIDRKGNGGDMCENHFKVVRDDISDWVSKGGSAELVLPAPLSLNQYNTGMLDGIAKAQVSCIDEAVTIGSTEKTCINFTSSDGTPQIVCNRKRFLSTSDEDQYVLVHHEYAGLAGFEANVGESSNYMISNQISKYLQDQVVKKLGIKPRSTPSCESIQQNLLKVGNKCITSVRVTYEYVWYPTMGWKGPDGVVWSYLQGQWNSPLSYLDDARMECSWYGGTLPTLAEYQQAEANGFREIFYDMTSRNFYWVSPASDNDPFATYFLSLNGEIGQSGWPLQDAKLAVRCVGK